MSKVDYLREQLEKTKAENYRLWEICQTILKPDVKVGDVWKVQEELHKLMEEK